MNTSCQHRLAKPPARQLSAVRQSTAGRWRLALSVSRQFKKTTDTDNSAQNNKREEMTEQQQLWFAKLAKDREDSATMLEKPSMRGIKNSIVVK